MKNSRRNFLQTSVVGLTGTSLLFNPLTATSKNKDQQGYADLDQALNEPVLKRELFPDPVIIERLELLRSGDEFICRVVSSDGVEGYSVSNHYQMIYLYPVFLRRLQPFFIGKDARNWEQLLDEVYVFKSNYKHQGLGLWVPLATVEFAVLDLLGKMAGKPMGELLGTVHHQKIAVYQANNYRGKSAEESIDLIRQQVEESQARALKFKVGGRMLAEERPEGRSEKLIPLVRKAFGNDMVIYADSNGSYEVQEAIRIGKLMQEYAYDFYEEPVPFDWYEETREVSAAVTVPIAGGEQEPSMHNFRWLIGNDALQVVQPDIFYFGGMIRSMKVARMAAARGLVCTPHISGSGLGYVYMLHFVSAVENAGPFHEFKGLSGSSVFHSPTSSLVPEGGEVVVPNGPGLGVNIDPDYLKQFEVIKEV